jgi:hypothetical protein
MASFAVEELLGLRPESAIGWARTSTGRVCSSIWTVYCQRLFWLSSSAFSGWSRCVDTNICCRFVPIIRRSVILFHRINGYVIVLLVVTSTVGEYSQSLRSDVWLRTIRSPDDCAPSIWWWDRHSSWDWSAVNHEFVLSRRSHHIDLTPAHRCASSLDASYLVLRKHPSARCLDMY